MTLRGVLQMVAWDPAPHLAGRIPGVGLGPFVHPGTSREEKARIADEAMAAGQLMTAAPRAQWSLLERLVRAAPGQQLEFPGIETLACFLDATRALDEAAAAALSDGELLARWAECMNR